MLTLQNLCLLLLITGLIDDTLIISLLVSEVASIAKAKLQSQNVRSSKSNPDVTDQVVDVQVMAAD